MLHAIIADDEKKVVELIEMLGNWDDCGIEIVDRCFDGQQTLDSIFRLSPHIVITDIRMPLYDGLQLITETHKQGLNPRFIIISGYKHFEYAHSAMKLGVVDYLLKPIDADQLQHTLLKISTEINEEQLLDLQHTKAAQIIATNRHQTHESFVEHLLQANSIDLAVKALNLRYMTSFQNGIYQALVINTDMQTLHAPGSSFSEKIAWQAEKTFPGCFDIITVSRPEGVYCILNYPATNADSAKKSLSTLFYGIRSLNEVYGKFNLSVGTSFLETEISNLPAIIQSARSAERTKIVYGYNKLLYPPQLSTWALKSRHTFSRLSIPCLLSCLEQLDEAGIGEWFDLASKYVSAGGPETSVEDLYHLRDDLSKELHSYIETQELSLESNFFETLFKESNHVTSTSAFLHHLCRDVFKVLTIRKKAYEKRQAQPIQHVRQYLQEHYAEPLSLEFVASQNNLTPTYFSSLFKKYTGSGFLEYLTEIRLKKAQELLCETRISITEIGHKCGYPDDKYFRQLFKKKIGIKPNDYRTLYRKRKRSEAEL